MTDWISVKDRRPKGNCLAFSAESDYFFEDYLVGWIEESAESKTGYICISDGEVLKNVTHWMPLPNPPEERNQ